MARFRPRIDRSHSCHECLAGSCSPDMSPDEWMAASGGIARRASAETARSATRRGTRWGTMGGCPTDTRNVDDGWRAVRAAAPADRRRAAKRGRLTFLGHSTVLIEVDDLRILTDPVLREGLGPVRRQVQAVLPELFADLDAVFISHGHHDHLDPPSLRRIPGKPTVIVPRGFGSSRRRRPSARSRRSSPATG